MRDSSWFVDWVQLNSWILLSAGRRCQGLRPRLALAAAVAVALPFVAACASRRAAQPTAAATLDEQMGTIRRVGAFGFAIVPDRDPGTRYVPDRPFPSEFRVDGLRVRFSGTTAETPDAVRQWGTSYRLATLRRAGP